MARLGRAMATGIDAARVWPATAVLYRLTADALSQDLEQASLFFHSGRLLISAAFHAVMLAWLSGTMGYVAMMWAVVVATTGNKPGTARYVLCALLGCWMC